MVARYTGNLSQRERRDAADAEGVCLRRRYRVDQQTQDRLWRAPGQQRRQQPGGVAVAAGAGVVLRVGEHDRRAGLASLQRARDRIGGVEELHREVAFGVGDGVRERGNGGLRARFVAAVTGDRHAAFGEIGHRKPRCERQHAAVLALEALEHRVETARRLDERALRRQPGEEIQRPQRLGRRVPRRDRRVEELRGALAGCGHVDMRISPVRHQSVAVLHHRARDVSVQIEARDHGNARADDRANAPQQLPLAIVEVLAHHGAVQVEIDAVDPRQG